MSGNITFTFNNRLADNFVATESTWRLRYESAFGNPYGNGDPGPHTEDDSQIVASGDLSAFTGGDILVITAENVPGNISGNKRWILEIADTWGDGMFQPVADGTVLTCTATSTFSNGWANGSFSFSADETSALETDASYTQDCGGLRLSWFGSSSGLDSKTFDVELWSHVIPVEEDRSWGEALLPDDGDGDGDGGGDLTPLYEPRSTPVLRFQMSDGPLMDVSKLNRDEAIVATDVGAISTVFLRSRGMSIVPKVDLSADSEQHRMINLMNYKDLRIDLDTQRDQEQVDALDARQDIIDRSVASIASAEGIITALEAQLADAQGSIFWKQVIVPAPGQTGEQAYEQAIAAAIAADDQWQAGAVAFVSTSDVFGDDTDSDVYILTGYGAEDAPQYTRLEGLTERFRDFTAIEVATTAGLGNHISGGDNASSRVSVRAAQETAAADVHAQVDAMLQDFLSVVNDSIYDHTDGDDGLVQYDNKRKSIVVTPADLDPGYDLVDLGVITAEQAANIDTVEVYVEGVRSEDLVSIDGAGVVTISSDPLFSYVAQIPDADIMIDMTFALDGLYAYPA